MYFAHIKRKNNILTTALEGKLEGKRPRGRPRNNWFGDIREWTKLSAYECASMQGRLQDGIKIKCNLVF